jgi:hypothetical protein
MLHVVCSILSRSGGLTSLSYHKVSHQQAASVRILLVPHTECVRTFVSLLAEGRWFLPKYIVLCIWVLSSTIKTDHHHKTEKLLCMAKISEQIDWLFTCSFSSRSRIFHLHGNVTIAGEFRPMLGAHAGPLSREGSLSCHICCEWVINWLIDWLIDWLIRVLRPAEEISHIWRRQHCRWRAAKFRPMVCAQGLWTGRHLYHATPAVTQDLGFSSLIRRTAPFSRLLLHKRGRGGSILNRIPMGLWHGASAFPVSSERPPLLVASYYTRGDVEDLY